MSMNLWVNSSADDDTLAALQPAAALPAGCYECGSARSLFLMFGGTCKDADAGTYLLSLWFAMTGGESDEDPTFIPWTVSTGAMTAGTLEYGDEAWIIGPAANHFCDTLTETLSCPRARVWSPANNSIAVLEVDLIGACAASIQTKRGTMASVDVIVDSHPELLIGDLA